MELYISTSIVSIEFQRFFYLLQRNVCSLLAVFLLYAYPNIAIVDYQTDIYLLEMQTKGFVRLTGVAPFKRL